MNRYLNSGEMNGFLYTFINQSLIQNLRKIEQNKNIGCISLVVRKYTSVNPIMNMGFFGFAFITQGVDFFWECNNTLSQCENNFEIF